MANQAEGGHDGITTAGPDNKFDGAGAHPEVDNKTSEDIGANIRIEMPWKTGEGAPGASKWVLGDVPD